MFQSNLICYLLCLNFLLGLVFSLNKNPLLLIISFDGFRYDFVNHTLSTSLADLRKNASYAPFMLSVFPTKTFPNHFSIATGFYTEVHGVLDNKLYEESSNKSLGYGYELFHYDEDVVPIWTLNERGGNGRRSGIVMWPGSDFSYQGTNLSYHMAYNSSVNWKLRVDTILNWFLDQDEPINLGMLYFEEPDTVCHKYGPNSKEIENQITNVNNIVKYLLEVVENSTLFNRLNIVLVSDHGCRAVKVPDHLINLDDFVDSSWFKRDGVPPNLQIYPNKGKEGEVLAALRAARVHSNFTTYVREEMPERWHYRHCRRTPPILVSCDYGYLFLDGKDRAITTPEIGTHGYDPEDPMMRALFMAVGPAFKRNFEVQPFENIHIYPLAAYMLGLKLPALQPNGSLSALKDILLRTSETSSAADKINTIYLGTVAAHIFHLYIKNKVA